MPRMMALASSGVWAQCTWMPLRSQLASSCPEGPAGARAALANLFGRIAHRRFFLRVCECRGACRAGNPMAARKFWRSTGRQGSPRPGDGSGAANAWRDHSWMAPVLRFQALSHRLAMGEQEAGQVHGGQCLALIGQGIRLMFKRHPSLRSPGYRHRSPAGGGSCLRPWPLMWGGAPRRCRQSRSTRSRKPARSG